MAHRSKPSLVDVQVAMGSRLRQLLGGATEPRKHG